MLRSFTRSQLLASGDAKILPTIVGNEISAFNPDGTITEAWNNLTAYTDVSLAPANLMGPVTLEGSESFIDLIFCGRFTAVTTNSLQGNTLLQIGATGILAGSLDEVALTYANHPVAQAGRTLEDTFERSGFLRSNLIVRGNVATVGVVGNPDGGAVTVHQTWPYCGQAHAVGEQWYLVFPVGRSTAHIQTAVGASESVLEVSGYKKIWFWMTLQNPATVTGINAPTIDWRLYANIYEPL